MKKLSYYVINAIFYVNLFVLAPVIVFALFNAKTAAEYQGDIMGLFCVLVNHIGFGYSILPRLKAELEIEGKFKDAGESVEVFEEDVSAGNSYGRAKNSPKATCCRCSDKVEKK